MPSLTWFRSPANKAPTPLVNAVARLHSKHLLFATLSAWQGLAYALSSVHALVLWSSLLVLACAPSGRVRHAMALLLTAYGTKTQPGEIKPSS